MALRPSTYSKSGTTLAETLVAVALIAAFFSAIFQLTAVCLRYIDSGKERVAALQGTHDRAEGLRNLLFTDLSNATTVQNLMVTPSNGSDFAQKVTEVVRLSAYPAPDASHTQITRGNL